MTDSTTLLSGKKFAIIGAGLVGGLLANYLARHDATVEIFEKRPDIRRQDLPEGRSIAMSLSHRGWKALEGVGLQEIVRKTTMPKTSRFVHLEYGGSLVQGYGKEGQALWTVNRRDLNSTLISAAEKTGKVRFHFLHDCSELNPQTGSFVCQDLATNERTNHQFDHIIGADGIFSKIRNSLCTMGHSQEAMNTLDYKYFEIIIPPLTKEDWALDNHFVHIWPRPEGLFVALPNFDRTFTGTLFYLQAKENSKGANQLHSLENKWFAEAFPEVAQLVPDLDHQLEKNLPFSISEVRCNNWYYQDKVSLIGDACHAIVPFYAMGMNMGFEDCTVFNQLVIENSGNMEAVFSSFFRTRKPSTDAIADLSLENFTSIGKSANPDYHRIWKIDRTIWKLFPEEWIPLYPMIHFSDIPLVEVAEKQKAQAEALRLIDKKLGNIEDPGDEEVRKAYLDISGVTEG